LMSTFADSKNSIDFVSCISDKMLNQKTEAEIIALLSEYIKSYNIKLIVINTNNHFAEKILKNLLFDPIFVDIKVLDIFDLYEYVFRKSSLDNLSYKNLIKSSEFDKDKKLYIIVKRILEVIISLPVFIVWALLHPFVYFYLKKEIKSGIGENSIFMTRTRMGKRGKKIKILKYRTMLYSDAGDKWLSESGNQNMVTPFGEFLRKTRIDELPQILAVIRGDLSLVGPRQDEVGLYQKLREEITNYDFRYIVTPGLSGWAQTMMSIQPKSIEESRLRFAYDMYYIKNQSIFLDLVIILRTIKTVLSREG
jgi:lipopolysaccharide/colanic/teichoic acid biosynthesis glycosyltransferase